MLSVWNECNKLSIMFPKKQTLKKTYYVYFIPLGFLFLQGESLPNKPACSLSFRLGQYIVSLIIFFKIMIFRWPIPEVEYKSTNETALLKNANRSSTKHTLFHVAINSDSLPHW